MRRSLESILTIRLFLSSAIALSTAHVYSQQAIAPGAKAAKAAQSSSSAKAGLETKRTTRFSFSRAPWKEVLQFLATNANLSLHIGELPGGSFTYFDSRAYSPDEAIDRINHFLIPQRFVLVRSDALLSVIALDDEAGIRQLDAMAEMLQPEDLARRSSRQLAKCLFPLGSAGPDQALQELGGLLLMQEPVVLNNTNQLLVTDTVGKLLTVHQVLSRLSTGPNSVGPIKQFPLGELEAEQALTQIRPHVGLEPLAMSSTDISISVDSTGRQLLVSGSNEKVKLVDEAMKLLRSTLATRIDRAPSYFRTHPIGTADLQTVSNVLQTLLADHDVRLAADAKSNQIALVATDGDHALVEKTIGQLAGADAVEFKAIPLLSIDPRHAVALLNSMFGAEPQDAKSMNHARPRIDADPSAERLFVRAKASQIEQIERLLEQLGEPGPASKSVLRLLPYRGDRGRRILEAAQRFWPDSESLQIIPSEHEAPDQPQELEVTPATRRQQEQKPPQSNDRAVRPSEPWRASANPKTKRATIRAQLTAKGLLIQASSPDELDRFEQHVRMVAGVESPSGTRLAVFYLKHATATQAGLLLRRWLEAESASASTVISSVGDSGLEPATVWSFGTATVFADSRLNRLFVYGRENELAKVEGHLQIIDRENSITQLSTHGTPRVLQLHHANVSDVVNVVRDAYAGRIAATADERRQMAQPNQQPQPATPSPRPDQARAPTAPYESAAVSSEQPGMTLATDLKSNSLIVTAPSQLADEVERLARDIDRQSENSVSVVTLKNSSADTVYTALTNILGDGVRKETANKSRH